MENTPNLNLPYLMPSQAQKHVTHNEALRTLDALVQLAVLDRDLTAPPVEPAQGDRYIVAAGAGGAWQGQDGRVASWQDGSWAFLAPKSGWVVFVMDEGGFFSWDGSAWRSLTETISVLQNIARFGLGTTADAQNPFAAKLNTALWAALGAGEGGTGDLRYTLNKEGAANVLSLLMQSGWAGRAEIGLVGDDDLVVKVSADGVEWKEALRVDRDNGRVSLPGTNLLRDFAVNLYADSGRFAGDAAKGVTVGAFAEPSYLLRNNGTTVASAGKFIHNNTDYGGGAGSLPAAAKDLIDKIRDPSKRRYGVEFHVAEYTMGSGTGNSVINIDGTAYYLSLLPALGPMVPRMTFHAYVRALDAPVLWAMAAGQTLIRDGMAHTNHQVIAPADGWVSMTVLHEADPYDGTGYQPDLFNLRAAQSGNRYQLACAAAMGGITAVDDNVGVISGYNRWL